MLVSNDEMRDHIFQLLAPRYFLRWKQRHQVSSSFEFTLPPFGDMYGMVFPICQGPQICQLPPRQDGEHG